MKVCGSFRQLTLVFGSYLTFVTAGVILCCLFYNYPDTIYNHMTDPKTTPPSAKKLALKEVPTPTEDKSTDVLINAYHRSGSSFLGLFFNYRRDTFYWYEPLWFGMETNYFSRDGRACDWRRSSCVEKYSFPLDEALTFIQDVYGCRLGKRQQLRFVDKFSYQTHDGIYKTCRDKSHRCFHKFAEECLTARHRVTKLVRLDIRHTETLLQNNPRLKVIQLMRDPRGIIQSRINASWYPIKESQISETETNAMIQCDRMKSDIQGAKELDIRFPNRVRIVQYEDIATHTDAIQTVFKWLGMDMPTGNVKIDELVRSSEGYRIDLYRDTLRYETVDMIQRQCADVIGILGLRMFKNDSEMRNRDISVVNGSLTFALS